MPNTHRLERLEAIQEEAVERPEAWLKTKPARDFEPGPVVHLTRELRGSALDGTVTEEVVKSFRVPVVEIDAFDPSQVVGAVSNGDRIERMLIFEGPCVDQLLFEADGFTEWALSEGMATRPNAEDPTLLDKQRICATSLRWYDRPCRHLTPCCPLTALAQGLWLVGPALLLTTGLCRVVEVRRRVRLVHPQSESCCSVSCLGTTTDRIYFAGEWRRARQCQVCNLVGGSTSRAQAVTPARGSFPDLAMSAPAAEKVFSRSGNGGLKDGLALADELDINMKRGITPDRLDQLTSFDRLPEQYPVAPIVVASMHRDEGPTHAPPSPPPPPPSPIDEDVI